MNEHGVRVEIYGQRYTVRGDADRAYVEALASYVDEKMRAVARDTATVDSVKLAVLAALNIADEYFRLCRLQDEDAGRVRERTDACARLLDGVLK